MPEQHPVEDRLAALEQAVRQLQNRLDALQGNSNWLQQIRGICDDIPEADFQEIVRLGREFRNADRPDNA